MGLFACALAFRYYVWLLCVAFCYLMLVWGLTDRCFLDVGCFAVTCLNVKGLVYLFCFWVLFVYL